MRACQVNLNDLLKNNNCSYTILLCISPYILSINLTWINKDINQIERRIFVILCSLNQENTLEIMLYINVGYTTFAMMEKSTCR